MSALSIAWLLGNGLLILGYLLWLRKVKNIGEIKNPLTILIVGVVFNHFGIGLAIFAYRFFVPILHEYTEFVLSIPSFAGLMLEGYFLWIMFGLNERRHADYNHKD